MILLVEDQPLLALLTQGAWKKVGYEVTSDVRLRSHWIVGSSDSVPLQLSRNGLRELFVTSRML